MTDKEKSLVKSLGESLESAFESAKTSAREALLPPLISFAGPKAQSMCASTLEDARENAPESMRRIRDAAACGAAVGGGVYSAVGLDGFGDVVTSVAESIQQIPLDTPKGAPAAEPTKHK